MVETAVMQGAEPFLFEGSQVGVLLSHGFTGTTQSMLPLGRRLAGAGYTVSAPRLPGHGTSPAYMATTGARDWVATIDAALAEFEDALLDDLYGRPVDGRNADAAHGRTPCRHHSRHRADQRRGAERLRRASVAGLRP